MKGVRVVVLAMMVSGSSTLLADSIYSDSGSRRSYGKGRILNAKSQDQLDRILSRSQYVVVQFLNPGCPVCKEFKRQGVFANTAGKFPKVRFVEVSSVQAPALHEKYNIQGTPTFIYFQDAKVVSELVGRVNQGSFDKRVARTFGLRDRD